MKRLLAAFSISLVSCMTSVKDPGAFREKKPSTVGFVGAMHHPTKGSGIGFSLDFPSRDSLRIRSGTEGVGATSVNRDDSDEPSIRKIYREEFSADWFLLSFPSDSSAFFYGLGATTTYARLGYSELTRNFSLNQTKATVEWTDTCLEGSIPLGFSTNYTNDTTAVLGVGPQMRVNCRRQFISDGSDMDVDEDLRDQTLRSYDSTRRGVTWQFVTMVGFSF